MKPIPVNRWKIVSISLFLLMLSLIVLGQSAESIYSPIDYILCMIATALMDVASALAALVFVFAGVTFIAAMDDPGKRKSAKDTMIHAIIGLIIILVAENIINSVSSIQVYCP